MGLVDFNMKNEFFFVVVNEFIGFTYEELGFNHEHFGFCFV